MFQGYAIVFNSLSENLGGFREIIRPEAVDRTIREKIDVRALIDHDIAKVIGRVSAGTLRLRPDAKGLRTEIDLPETGPARDVAESIKRRDITGMSFAFRTVTDDWHMEDEVLIREILDMRILEVSIVAFPAYPATEADLRSRQRGLGSRSAERRYANPLIMPSPAEPYFLEARPSRRDPSFRSEHIAEAAMRCGVFQRTWEQRGRVAGCRLMFRAPEGVDRRASNEARQADVAREIFATDRRAEEALLEGASDLAWRWAAQYGQGLAQPDWGASEAERLGWRLHRLGYHQPPVRILQQRLARSMR